MVGTLTKRPLTPQTFAQRISQSIIAKCLRAFYCHQRLCVPLFDCEEDIYLLLHRNLPHPVRLSIEMLLLLLNKLAILLFVLQDGYDSIPVNIIASLAFIYKTVHVIK